MDALHGLRRGNEAVTDFLSSGGDMAGFTRVLNWSVYPVGPPERWFPALRIVLRLMQGKAVEHHDERNWVESELQRGAVFHFTFAD